MRKLSFLFVPLVALTIAGCSGVQTTDHTTSLSAGTKIQFAFTHDGENPATLLIGVIDEAKTTLDIAIYSITHPDIVKAIIDAKKRGVAVRIITDQSQANGKTQKQALKLLRNAGIPIKQNTHSGLMHDKFTIADNAVVTTGSFNYSKAAATTNDENLAVIPDAEAAEIYTSQFNRMWEDTKGFAKYTN